MFRLEQPGDENYETSYTYRALLPAQDILKGNGLFQFNHEQRVLFNDETLLTANLELKPSTAETFERELPNERLLHTVAIKAGVFLMGYPDLNTGLIDTRALQEEIPHMVRLTKDFYMCKYEVTNAQYAIFLNDIGVGSDAKCPASTVYSAAQHSGEILVKEKPTGWPDSYIIGVKWDGSKWIPVPGYENYPLVCVSWNGADEYAHWVGGSLPTEAQWEYAETSTVYSFGNDANELGDYAWYEGNRKASVAGPNGYNRTHEVGTKKPNQWGLYDMHGNVSEWCLDQKGAKYGLNDSQLSTIVVDPKGGDNGDRIARGGAWTKIGQTSTNTDECRSVYRFYHSATACNHLVGFRVIFER